MPMSTCTCGTRTDAANASCPSCGAELSASKIGNAVTVPMAAITPPVGTFELPEDGSPERRFAPPPDDLMARGTLPQHAKGTQQHRPKKGETPTVRERKRLEDSHIGPGANRVFAPSLDGKEPVRPPVLPARTIPASPRPRPTKLWPFVVGGFVLVGAVVGLLLLGMRGTDPPQQVVEPVAPTPPIGPDTPVVIASADHLLVAEHAAIARGDRAGLLALMELKAFGFGPDGTQVAYGSNALASQVLATIGTPPPGGFTVASKYLKIGSEGGIAWIVNDLEISGGGRTAAFTTTQVATRVENKWSIVAWHWAVLVSNPLAAKLAKEGKLPAAAPLRAMEGGGDLRPAFERAMSSRKALLEAISPRADAFNIGSAPYERLVGATTIRRWLRGTSAELKLRDEYIAQLATEHAGWAAANVDYTLVIDKVPTTQTFRVLAVLLEDSSGWKVVALHWSNAGPVAR
jgi:hypothetical protein